MISCTSCRKQISPLSLYSESKKSYCSDCWNKLQQKTNAEELRKQIALEAKQEQLVEKVFEERPIWVQGAIAGLVIAITLVIIHLILTGIVLTSVDLFGRSIYLMISAVSDYYFKILAATALPISMVLRYIPAISNNQFFEIVSLLLLPLNYSIIGLAIGLCYGKIKGIKD